MAITSTGEHRIRGIASCVPERVFDTNDSTDFPQKEIDAVVKMVGIRTRHLSPDTVCSSDLCLVAARSVMEQLDWGAGDHRLRDHGHTQSGLSPARDRLRPPQGAGPVRSVRGVRCQPRLLRLCVRAVDGRDDAGQPVVQAGSSPAGRDSFEILRSDGSHGRPALRRCGDGHRGGEGGRGDGEQVVVQPADGWHGLPGPDHRRRRLSRPLSRG